jgi:putative peptidoglycan lipid II flippase
MPSRTMKGPLRKHKSAVSAFALSASTGVVALLSLWVQLTVVTRFGVGRESDAYFAALTIPNAAASIFLASLPSLLLAVFIEQKVKVGERSAWSVASALLNVMMLLFGLLVAVGMIFSRQISHTLLPGFDPTTAELSNDLLRILSPMALLSALAALLGGILQAYGKFFEFSLGKIARWLVVASIAYWAGSIYGVAIGMIAGLIVHTLFYLCSLRDVIGLYRPTLTCVEPIYRVLLKSWVILLITSTVSQSHPILQRYFASGLESGSVSYISFASNLIFLLDMLLANSVSSVLFPRLSESISSQDGYKSGLTISLAVRISGFIAVPFVFELIVFRKEIVRLLLGRGAFRMEDTLVLSDTILFLAGSMFAPVFSSITSKALFSLRAVSFLFVLSIVNTIMYVCSMLVLIQALGFRGLVLSSSIVTTISWILQMVYLRWRIKDIPVIRMFRSLVAVLGASVICTFFSRILYQVLATFFKDASNALLHFAMLGVVISLGLGMYVLTAVIFRFEEMRLLREKLR